VAKMDDVVLHEEPEGHLAGSVGRSAAMGEHLRRSRCDDMREVAIIGAPQPNYFPERNLGIALPCDPRVAVVAVEDDRSRALADNEAPVVIAGGIDKMAKDFPRAPASGGRPLGRARLIHAPEYFHSGINGGMKVGGNRGWCHLEEGRNKFEAVELHTPHHMIQMTKLFVLLLKGATMRILYGAVIVAVGLGAGCGSRDNDPQTPTAQAPAPAPAPAPAAAPAGRAGGAPAAAPAAAAPAAAPAGRQGGAAAGAQVTIAAHEAAMKTIATANMALGAALKGGDLPGVQTQAKILATQFTTVENFWTQRAKPDAIKIAQGARQGAMTMSTAADIAAAQAAQPAVGGACKQCHSVYREMDPAGGFRIAASAGITQ